MKQQFFRRNEKKYLLNQEQFAHITRALSEHAQPDAYHKTRIHNVYFDTADSAIVAELAERYGYRVGVDAAPSGGAIFFVTVSFSS